MRLDPYINELLYSHDCVIVPGLGGFVTHIRGAFLNPAQHTFAPPARKVAFNAGLRLSDGILAQAISQNRAISFNEAMDLIQTFVDDVIQRLVAGETILIDKVGTLVYDKERNLQFEPETGENYLQSSFGLSLVHSPAIRRDEKKSNRPNKSKVAKKEKVAGKSRWRLLELVPAAAILALLAFNPKVTRDLNTSLANMNPFASKSISMPVEEADYEENIFIDSQNSESGNTESTGAVTIENEVSDEQPVSNEIVEADTTHVAVSSIVAPANNEVTYMVIGGCFREEANAERFIQQAMQAGFNAERSGFTNGGLHIVSLYSGNNFSKATELLEEARITIEPGAWLKRAN